ncbi:MAG: MOSC domain-containing protein [Planctomycetota bacterium]
MYKIHSIQIGKVITEGDPESRHVTEKQWTSAFRKQPVCGPVAVSSIGIDGDFVADTKHHGGPDKAILCYPLKHYEDWANEHPELTFAGGGFGENLTLDGMSESDVCIGDRLVTSGCEFQVSQPRQPCWKIARRWQVKSMTKEVAQTGRTGFYVRVLRGGTLQPGENVEIADRPNSAWSVSRANDILFGREVDRAAVMELMAIPELSNEWKASIA